MGCHLLVYLMSVIGLILWHCLQMPKHEKKILKYSQQNMLDAIAEVNQGKSVKATAKKYGLPRVTLMYKVKGKLPVGKRMGPKSLFSPEQENILAEWVISMAKSGFPVTKSTFMTSVAKLAKELKLEKTPGEKWYKLFRARNPRISDRIYQTLTRSRANVTSEDLARWFQEVWSYFEQNNLVNVMNNPSKVFNADESAFYMNPKGGKVLAEKGSKSVYLAGANDEKENITILLTANAEGRICPPMVVYRYKRVPLQIAESVPSDWAIGRSENGWMTQELFYEYITNIFHPWLLKEKIELPVVFFLDGHSSHISLHLSEFCNKNGIEMVALYPNATHLIQPMDVAVFHSLKLKWKKQVQEWRISHTGEELKKKDFPQLLQRVLGDIDPVILQNGFKKCGLLPWNPQIVTLPLNNQPRDAEKVNVTDINEIKKLIIYLENEIGEEKMLEFKNNEDDWKGPKEDTSLYRIWKQIKNKLLEQPTLHENNNNPNITTVGTENIAEGLRISEDIVTELVTSENVTVQLSSSKNIAVELPTSNNIVAELKLSENNIKPSEEQSSDISIIQPGPSGFKLVGVLTPDKENNSCNQTTSVDPSIPSPFKRVLFWPENQPSTSKRQRREKLPSVLTSPQVIRYYQKKEEDKQQMIEKQRKKKEQRLQKQKETQDRKKAAEEQKKNKEKNKIKRSKPDDVDSTTSDSLSVDSASSSPWDEDFEEDNDDLCYEPINFQNLMEGDFVLCEFLGGKRKKTKYIYLCVVEEKILSSSIQVMGFKSTDKQKKEFLPNESDISSISIDQVIGKVPHPEIISRGERFSYVFKRPLPIKEL